jgi:polyisoprenoid-binding protein YceI
MKFNKLSALFLGIILVLASCGKSSDTVETTDAMDVAEGSGQTLTVDATSSTMSWTGYKPGGQHFGTIPMTSGELTVEGDAITGGKFVFDIKGLTIGDMPQTDESYGKLNGHLLSADFFDAENHPEATFEITSVEAYAAGDVISNKEEFVTDNTPKKDTELAPSNPTHWISGNLTMRGTTKNIKFPANVNLANGVVTAKAGFNIDRTAWGLSYGDESTAVNKAKDKFIYNTVSLQLDVNAK